ncbi:MAG: hypothetical protein IV100_05810 [Myxococcales bacterium]|nr:hypothetical protein [Myxococcales bacterium]
MNPINPITQDTVRDALRAEYPDESVLDLADVAAFLAVHPELGFTLAPGYAEERGIMAAGVMLVAAPGDATVYPLIVAPELFGPFASEADTVVDETFTEVATRLARCHWAARALAGVCVQPVP